MTFLLRRSRALGALTGLALAALVGASDGLVAQEEDSGVATMVAAGLSQGSGADHAALLRAVTSAGADGAEARRVMVDFARRSGSAVTVARALGLMVRAANETPGTVGEAVGALTEFVQDPNFVKRAIAVDAMENMPASGRSDLVSVLAERVRSGGDTPTSRLCLRGLWELGAEGLAEIQSMVDQNELTGGSLEWARVYLREGA